MKAKIKNQEPKGDCFIANTNYFFDLIFNDKKNKNIFCLVHGIVKGAKYSKVEGLEFYHCWIETIEPAILIDHSNNNKIKIPLNIIKDRIVSKQRFSYELISKLLLKYKHYGHFENEKGDL